jgi:hypothetical protein
VTFAVGLAVPRPSRIPHGQAAGAAARTVRVPMRPRLAGYLRATTMVSATIASVKPMRTQVSAISLLDERADAVANASITVRRSAMSFGEAGSSGCLYTGTSSQLYGPAWRGLRRRAPRLRRVEGVTV